MVVLSSVYLSFFPVMGLMILGFLVAFIIVYFAIPLIVKAAIMNNFFAYPNGRTSHTKPTPVFGGVAIFAGFIISAITFAGSFFDSKFIYSFLGWIIIFIVGLTDDLTVSKPGKKLMGQLLATFCISVLADIRISNMHGFLNIGDISYIASIARTMFILIVMINGFNLIDGIDGLASGVGILISTLLGIWFYISNDFLYSILSLALAGALIAFFYFNVFSKRNKIFLGDTGSLFLGLILGMMVIRFLQYERSATGLGVFKSIHAIAISLFIIPLFDTLRIFIIRISQGKSPFKADRQHIHHRLLEIGFSHFQSTIILLSYNLICVIVCYLLQNLGNMVLLAMLLTVSILLSYILLILATGRVLIFKRIISTFL